MLFRRKIQSDKWRETPHIVGRTALYEDVKAHRAVFYDLGSGNIKGEPYELQLPRCAIIQRFDGIMKNAVVIQAEVIQGKVLLGYRAVDGQLGTCTLLEVFFVDNPNNYFFTGG